MCTLSENISYEHATVWMKCNICYGWLPSMSALRQHGEKYHGKNKISLQHKSISEDKENKIHTTYDTPYHRNTTMPPQLPLSSIKVLSYYYPNRPTDDDTVNSGLTSEHSRNESNQGINIDDSHQQEKCSESSSTLKSDMNTHEPVTYAGHSRNAQGKTADFQQRSLNLGRLSRKRVGTACDKISNQFSVNRISLRRSRNLRLALNDSDVTSRPTDSDSDSSSNSDVAGPPKRKKLKLTVRQAKACDVEWTPHSYHLKPTRSGRDSTLKLSTRSVVKTKISLRRTDAHGSVSAVEDDHEFGSVAGKRGSARRSRYQRIIAMDSDSSSNESDDFVEPARNKNRDVMSSIAVSNISETESTSSDYDSDDLFEEIKTVSKKTNEGTGATGKTPNQAPPVTSAYVRVGSSSISGTSRQISKCKFCSREYEDANVLAKHYLTVHPNDPQSLHCGNCKTDFRIGIIVFNKHLKECVPAKKT